MISAPSSSGYLIHLTQHFFPFTSSFQKNVCLISENFSIKYGYAYGFKIK